MWDAPASRGRHAHVLHWEPYGKEAMPTQEIPEASTMQPAKPLGEVVKLRWELTQRQRGEDELLSTHCISQLVGRLRL